MRSGRVGGDRVRHGRPLGAQVSLDTEGLFDLEGMEEAAQDPEHFQSEEETDDTDGKTTKSYIHKLLSLIQWVIVAADFQVH